LYEYIESLEKCREEREVKLKIELEKILDNKFKSSEENIETNMENRILGLESELQKMEARL
jgi:hypothetical protein